MFVDESAVEYIRPFVAKQLKTLGVKFSAKKLDYKVHNDGTNVRNPFETSLDSLEMDYVTLPCGIKTKVPVFLIDSVDHIERDLHIEGLFRKSGSAIQKKILKALLEKGGRLSNSGSESSVITVGEMLKLWLRQLPEPLIPYKLHDVFLKCLASKKGPEEAVLACCLLLPSTNLFTLAYLMQFLLKVSENSKRNRMCIENLAIIFAPNMMPVKGPCKLTSDGSEQLNKHVKITEILIANAKSIGVIPAIVSEQLEANSMSESDAETPLSDKRKKIRSNSLTRAFGVLRRIMRRPSTPDEEKKFTTFRLFLTPKTIKASKNGEGASGLDSKRAEKHSNMTPVVKFSSTTTLTPRTMVARNDSPKSERLRPRRTVSFKDTAGTCSRSTSDSTEYIQVPKVEFDLIKERMSILETRLNDEVDKTFALSIREADLALMSASAANRRVKRMLSERYVRSPSARKIGRMRRRSNVEVNCKLEKRVDENEQLCARMRDETIISGDDEQIVWKNANEFFRSNQIQDHTSSCPRESVQILRNNQAGNVREKKRIFEDKTLVHTSKNEWSFKSKEGNLTALNKKSLNPTEGSAVNTLVTRPCTRLRRGTALAKGSSCTRKNVNVRKNSSAATSRRSPRIVQKD